MLELNTWYEDDRTPHQKLLVIFFAQNKDDTYVGAQIDAEDSLGESILLIDFCYFLDWDYTSQYMEPYTKSKILNNMIPFLKREMMKNAIDYGGV